VPFCLRIVVLARGNVSLRAGPAQGGPAGTTLRPFALMKQLVWGVRRSSMPALILWLLGVPLSVIILIYLIF